MDSNQESDNEHEEEGKFVFDPSTGKLKVVPAGDSEPRKFMFDPSTGKLKVVPAGDSEPLIVCGLGEEGFFGCTYLSKIPHVYKPAITRIRDMCGPTSSQKFYDLQSKHHLNKEEQEEVPIWICRTGDVPIEHHPPDHKRKSVHESWIPHLQNALRDINDAAPGLNLYLCEKEADAKIAICGTTEQMCYTVAVEPYCHSYIILLSDVWGNKKRTSCHELLHALFFKHEHQRKDAGSYAFFNTDNNQVKPRDDIVGLTRFDPFSIMLYPESARSFTRNTSADNVWKLKAPGKVNEEMSELDKIALNIVYSPCIGPKFTPKKGATHLWYCGRKDSTKNHNRPAAPLTNGRCGPFTGPNCPACRVLENPFLEKIWAEDKWQGWSGMVYCGKWFGEQKPGHDGYCGPNNGPACPDCMKYVWPGLLRLIHYIFHE